MAPSSTGGGSCGIQQPADDADRAPSETCACPEDGREVRITDEGVEVCTRCGLEVRKPIEQPR